MCVVCCLPPLAERSVPPRHRKRFTPGRVLCDGAQIQAAANAYMLAHTLELEELHGESPSPYALLNQLTLEMLAGARSSCLMASAGARLPAQAFALLVGWLVVSHFAHCWWSWVDLSGSGDPDERSRLLGMTTTAGVWAKEKQIISPTDVWLWVQGVDAMCLQYLLGDGIIPEQTIVDAYKEQFAFGASQRVKVWLVAC